MNKRHYFLLIVAISVILGVMQSAPIPQDVHYHYFADSRCFLGIPNFYNVISNLPFFIAGVLGVHLLVTKRPVTLIDSLRPVYMMFFVGLILVSAGSSLYHLEPTNDSLLWDRLPMAIAFITLFIIVMGEYIHEKVAGTLFLPLMFTGLSSVIYWYWSEAAGQGDLRPYVLVQFMPVLLIPLILLSFRSRFSHGGYYWLIMLCYLLAKMLEMTDQLVSEHLGLISGHSLKHLVSAFGAYLFYFALRRRTVRRNGPCSQPTTFSGRLTNSLDDRML